MRNRNHHAGCCGINPTRPDGTEWPVVLALPDGSTVQADTPAEALEELMPGYLTLDDRDRSAARVRHGRDTAGKLQEALIRAAASDGLDPNAAEAEGLLDVLRADKRESLFLELPHAPGVQAPWLPRPALVLLTTSYAPHGAHPRIGGNVVWLDPSSEEGYLSSLGATSAFSFWAAGQNEGDPQHS